MNIYIWHWVRPVVTNYHDQGGVVQVAKSLDEARLAWREYAKEFELESDDALSEDPDETYELAGDSLPKVMVFPDSGCC